MSNFDTNPESGLRISEVDLCAWVAQAKPEDILLWAIETGGGVR